MTGASRSFPPPDDAAARYDAVVRRGRSLRRRRQLTTGAGAGGALLAVGLAFVLLLGNNGDPQPDVVADETTTTTTTTMPGRFTVSVEPTGDGSALEVTALNPRLRYSKSEMAAQCVTIEVLPLEGQELQPGVPLVAEGFDCNSSDGVQKPVEVQPDGSAVTCAALSDRQTAIEKKDERSAEPDTRPAADKWTFDVPDLPPGTYSVVADVASGDGDGCLPEQRGYEYEDNARGTATLIVP